MEGFEKGVKAHVKAELEPFVPLTDDGGGSIIRDSFGECFCSSVEMIAEMNAGGGVQTR